jgi:hypothetical protein
MTTSNLIRLSGLAAILGGLLFIVGILLQPDPSISVAGVREARTLAILFALIGLYAFQVEESGLWGFLGFVAAFIGNTLVMTGETPLSGSIYAVGLILLAIGSWLANKLPRWVPVLWILAPLIGMPGFFLESLGDLLFNGSGIVLGVSFIGAGYVLWSSAGEPAGRPQAAT